MKVPNPEKAVIPQSKLVDYLLSLSHPYGRSKGRFFTQQGFSPERWQVLEEALRRHATECVVTERFNTAFGLKLVVEGNLVTPKGKIARIRSVWFVETDESFASFVTAYPL
jgi:hypothetical protein